MPFKPPAITVLSTSRPTIEQLVLLRGVGSADHLKLLMLVLVALPVEERDLCSLGKSE
jgi:hypothetical protein